MAIYYFGMYGNDQNDGTTSKTAFRSSAKALALAKEGDELWLVGLTYRDSITIPLKNTGEREATEGAD